MGAELLSPIEYVPSSVSKMYTPMVTEYGKYLKSLEEISYGILNEFKNIPNNIKEITREYIYEEVGIDEDEIENILYAVYINSAIGDSKNGNYEKILRIMQRNFQDGYEDLNNSTDIDGQLSPIEAKKIFLEMGKEQYGNITIDEINNELPSILIKTNPIDENSDEIFDISLGKKEKLIFLEKYIHTFKNFSNHFQTNLTKGEDMKALYYLILLEDSLKKDIYGNSDVTNSERNDIDALKNKLK